MKKVYIIGAGAFGRELESWLGQSPEYGKTWQIAGYLHSGEHNHAEYPSAFPVMGDWQTFEFGGDDLVILGIADSEWKRRIWDALHSKVEFMTFIHPSTVIGNFSSIAAGVVICPYSVISTNVVIGIGATINCGSLIGHDVQIGDFSSLMAHVDLGGWSQVGSDVFMGTKSTLVPKKKLGDHCKISAGAVVMRNVKQGKTMFGNPAEELC